MRKHLYSVKMILIGPDLAGNPMAMANKATGEFFEPIVQDYVLSGLATSGDFESMSPEERSQLVDQRLDSVNKFPSLPEYLWQLVDFKTFLPRSVSWFVVVLPSRSCSTYPVLTSPLRSR